MAPRDDLKEIIREAILAMFEAEDDSDPKTSNQPKKPGKKDTRSQAAKDAERLGLTAKPYGKFADDSGKIVAKSEKGKLVRLNKGDDAPSTTGDPATQKFTPKGTIRDPYNDPTPVHKGDRAARYGKQASQQMLGKTYSKDSPIVQKMVDDMENSTTLLSPDDTKYMTPDKMESAVDAFGGDVDAALRMVGSQVQKLRLDLANLYSKPVSNAEYSQHQQVRDKTERELQRIGAWKRALTAYKTGQLSDFTPTASDQEPPYDVRSTELPDQEEPVDPTAQADDAYHRMSRGTGANAPPLDSPMEPLAKKLLAKMDPKTVEKAIVKKIKELPPGPGKDKVEDLLHHVTMANPTVPKDDSAFDNRFDDPAYAAQSQADDAWNSGKSAPPDLPATPKFVSVQQSMKDAMGNPEQMADLMQAFEMDPLFSIDQHHAFAKPEEKSFWDDVRQTVKQRIANGQRRVSRTKFGAPELGAPDSREISDPSIPPAIKKKAQELVGGWGWSATRKKIKDALLHQKSLAAKGQADANPSTYEKLLKAIDALSPTVRTYDAPKNNPPPKISQPDDPRKDWDDYLTPDEIRDKELDWAARQSDTIKFPSLPPAPPTSPVDYSAMEPTERQQRIDAMKAEREAEIQKIDYEESHFRTKLPNTYKIQNARARIAYLDKELARATSDDRPERIPAPPREEPQRRPDPFAKQAPSKFVGKPDPADMEARFKNAQRRGGSTIPTEPKGQPPQPSPEELKADHDRRVRKAVETVRAKAGVESGIQWARRKLGQATTPGQKQFFKDMLAALETMRSQ